MISFVSIRLSLITQGKGKNVLYERKIACKSKTVTERLLYTVSTTMWLERFIGICQENVGLSEMSGGMIMFQKECLKMTITNFCGTLVCEQTMKLGQGDRK